MGRGRRSDEDLPGNAVRLKALLPSWMPWIRKGFRLRREVEKQLLKISARQIDRRLKVAKTQKRRRIYGRTKPGYLLKHHIPVKTDRWDVQSPGLTEVDLVRILAILPAESSRTSST
jgi:hypothetical protein